MSTARTDFLSNEGLLQLTAPLALLAVTNGKLKGVSILTKGEAKGHGAMIDDRTLEQFMTLADGKKFPAYLTHAGAPFDRLGEEMGIFSKFTRDGDQIRADFSFLAAFLKGHPTEAATVLELADEHPDQLGISPVMRALEVWPMPNGDEIECVGLDSRPTDCLSALPSLRPTAVKSCDFVQNPAANVGLYTADVDGKSKNKPPMSTPKTYTLEEFNAAVAAEAGKLTALAAQHTIALDNLKAAHVVALGALQKQLDDAVASKTVLLQEKAQLESSLAAKTKELGEVIQFDMRRAGAPALQVALETAVGGAMPKPAETDAGKWAQYAELCDPVKDARGNVIDHKETPRAKAFREKHLSRDHGSRRIA